MLQVSNLLSLPSCLCLPALYSADKPGSPNPHENEVIHAISTFDAYQVPSKTDPGSQGCKPTLLFGCSSTAVLSSEPDVVPDVMVVCGFRA
ncbi:uncharacterized protein RAG0_15346 [Rhynchosporium agropyri]|uniref:Secreted protein n=1 Tax=Rhynchosporium agropyri TaxID=914238 RepID=A0A1E1LKU4_9HELO|nr:uncharacterized protein RAG0_15346 [Rhynchosporium agropyri]